MLHNQPPEPWHSFFVDIDQALDQPIALSCIDGFAIAMLYVLPRPTVDVDCLSVVPAEEIGRLDALAGMGSALHHKYGVYVQHVGIVTVPENYEERMIPIFPAAYRKLHLAGLEAHDLALSKLERNSSRDREDIKFLARVVPLSLTILEDRYRSELRPCLAAAERHDLTMRLWLDMLASCDPFRVAGPHGTREASCL